MSGPGPSKSWAMIYLTGVITGWVLMWFVPFTIDLAFWIGIFIIILGQVVYASGYIAMREHPEKNKAVVDWGIYKVSRHSHILAGIICLLGAIVMGWNTASFMYIILWVYFIVYVIAGHFGVLNEERKDIELFGREYENYMKRVPRYFLRK